MVPTNLVVLLAVRRCTADESYVPADICPRTGWTRYSAALVLAACLDASSSRVPAERKIGDNNTR